MIPAGFVVLALCTLAAAVGVVRSANLIHAVLWLGAALVATAGLYAILGASLLAGVQVLVYVGGLITLMIFGVMVTRRHDGISVRAESRNTVRGAIAAVSFFAIVAWAIRATPGLDIAPTAPEVTPADLGRAFLGPYVLAFEALSVLLLAAMVGAIVIARRRDPGAPNVSHTPSVSLPEVSS